MLKSMMLLGRFCFITKSCLRGSQVLDCHIFSLMAPRFRAGSALTSCVRCRRVDIPQCWQAVLTGRTGQAHVAAPCWAKPRHACMPGLGVATSGIDPTGLLLHGHVSFNLRMRISFRAAGLARPADSFITCLRLRTRAWSATATCRSIRSRTLWPAVHALLHGQGTAQSDCAARGCRWGTALTITLSSLVSADANSMQAETSMVQGLNKAHKRVHLVSGSLLPQCSMHRNCCMKARSTTS